ncbi:YcaO-like family protein [bacterium]|nr:YcaO-like family protein [bacterium]
MPKCLSRNGSTKTTRWNGRRSGRFTHNTTRFLPTAFCYYNYPDRPPTICHAHSNGNAAGNTLEEAILQGFLELIERDSVAIWWYNRLKKPLVDWTSFGLPYLEDVRKYHQDLDREIWVLDITSDLEVPSFAALSRCTNGAEERILAGFGAHLDARIALLRAVTELNQAIVWTDKNQPFPAELYESMETDVCLNNIRASDLPHVIPDTNRKPLVASDYPRLWTNDLKEDVLILRNIVEKERMEVLVLDQTRPDIGLPVVKVIVPELRHFWPRFAPGRLYDVPLKQGWVSESLSEEQLNPIMIFV